MASSNTPREERLNAEARALLDDPRVGAIIRQACGAAPSSRRDRWQAAGALVDIAQRAPLLAEVISRATGMAWRERLARVLVADEPGQSIRNVNDLLRELGREGEP